YPQAGPDSGGPRTTPRDRLEGQPGSAGAAAGTGDFGGGSVVILDSAAAAQRRTAAFSGCAVLFRGRGPGVHSGRNRFHSAVRAVPGTSYIRLDGGDFPANAVERRRQPVFAAMVAARRDGVDSARARGRGA